MVPVIIHVVIAENGVERKDITKLNVPTHAAGLLNTPRPVFIFAAVVPVGAGSAPAIGYRSKIKRFASTRFHIRAAAKILVIQSSPQNSNQLDSRPFVVALAEIGINVGIAKKALAGK